MMSLVAPGMLRTMLRTKKEKRPSVVTMYIHISEDSGRNDDSGLIARTHLTVLDASRVNEASASTPCQIFRRLAASAI